MLDTGPLSRVCDPARNQEVASWLKKLIQSEVVLYIPEIADYEARRGMLAKDMTRAVKILDQLKDHLNYAPLSTPVMLRAAELWAQARKRGKPTADPKELDGDVILAAQAQEVGAIVATENIGHLSQFVTAKSWKEIASE